MNWSGSQAAHKRPDPNDADGFGQVLRFRRRGEPPVPTAWPADPEAARPDDLAKYEQERDEQDRGEQDLDEVTDYRQRMLMNVIALAVVTFLISAGVWLADAITDMEKDQDCVMQGRVNCAPIELPSPQQQ